MCRTRNTKEPISYSLYTAIKNGPTGRKVHDICSDSRHNETRAKLRDLSAISRFTFTDRRIRSLLYIEHYHIHGFYTFPVAIMPIHFFSLCRCQMIATPPTRFLCTKREKASSNCHASFVFSFLTHQRSISNGSDAVLSVQHPPIYFGCRYCPPLDLKYSGLLYRRCYST